MVERPIGRRRRGRGRGRTPEQPGAPTGDTGPGDAGSGAPGSGDAVPGGAEPDAGAGPTTFDDQLETLGFRVTGASKRGGRMWSLPFNRFLTFVLHDYQDAVVLSWSFALGDYLAERGWQSSLTDLSAAELYPQRDVKVPLDIEAVGGEITRVLASLRLDLGNPEL